MEDDAPNEHGALLTFADDLDEWRWEQADAVTGISARAVRLFLGELGRNCALVIYPEDDGATVVMVAFGGELRIEADLGGVLRDFAANERWHANEKAAFKGVLQDVLKAL